MGVDEVLTAPLVIEYPFSRTTGPVIGAFLTGAARGVHRRHQGCRRPGARAAGRVRPGDRRGRSPRSSRSATPARSPRGRGSTDPRAGQPLDRPFAWALDPARRRRHRRCCTRSTPAAIARPWPRACGCRRGGGRCARPTSTRRQPTRRRYREGHILDIECFEPEAASRMSDVTLPGPLRRRRAGQEHPHAGQPRLRRTPPGRRAPSSCSGVAEKQLVGQRCPVVPEGLRAAARLVPDRRRADRPTRSSSATRAPSPRSASSTCRSTGRLMELPYVERADPARRRRHPAHAPHPGGPVDRGAHGHARRGGVGARRGDRPDAREHPVLPADRRARRALRDATRTTSDARRRDRLVRADRARARGADDQRGRDADAGARRGARAAPASARTGSTSSARAAPTTWPASRSPSS